MSDTDSMDESLNCTKLPTKHISPGKLSMELRRLLGDDTHLKVEVSCRSLPHQLR